MCSGRYCRAMTRGYEDRVVPLLAVGTIAVAAFSDPGSTLGVVLLVVGGVILSVGILGPLPLQLATPAVILAVGAALVGGHLEPGLFLVSLLALELTASLRFTVTTGVLLAALVVTPWAIDLANPEVDLRAAIWTLGIVFPAALGWGLQRQHRLTEELEKARYALAERAVSQERQRIAREVHDLVGHGLAAALVQVASARHVLHRDPDSADEALAHAERIGRASMSELRATVQLLREDAADDGRALPRLTELDSLVADARAQGLEVSLCTTGDPAAVDPVVGLALVRIGQEALTNAVRHAPRSRTVVSVAVSLEDASLEVTSHGAAPAAARHDGFGLVGMRERAQLVGGYVEAGPADDGWRVCCRVPLDTGGAT